MSCTLIFIAMLALLGLVPHTQALQTDETLVPSVASKRAYCSKVQIVLPKRREFRGGTPPFRLAIYEADLEGTGFDVSNGNFTHVSETPLYVGGVPDFLWQAEAKYVTFSWVVDVPYGNYVLGSIVDSTGFYADNNTLGPIWVAGGGGGECNQTEFTLPYDAASMAVKSTGTSTSGSGCKLLRGTPEIFALTGLAGLTLLL